MKIRLLFPLVLVVCAVVQTFAQTQNPSSNEEQQPLAHAVTSVQTPASVLPPVTAVLSMKTIGNHVDEAKRLLKSVANTPSDFVTLAALDRADSRLHLLPLAKEFFLKRGAEMLINTSHGAQVRVTVVRANGVNTAVQILDTASGRSLMPLVVQYPISRDGQLREMAYYTSVHPALLSPEIVREGGSYVRTMLESAASRLRAQGEKIEPEIVDIAEHLCIVEHTDHGRFMREDRAALFQEILSLYALNEPDTYRYSVSSAGAGGMVQMIPSTYAMVRRLHPDSNLKEDFVSGMTDHSNALEAMLLYMQDTWDDLLKSADVRDALSSGLATQPELVAAGYNSNPARLPSYIRRGGADWRTLIPTETQMYLRIYASLDQLHFKHQQGAPKRLNQPAAPMPLLAKLANAWSSGVNHSASLTNGRLPLRRSKFLIADALLSVRLR
ncbi:MAG TPA: hypothetical protein VF658_03790 [Pyrinomonadaceae bacterium]